MFVALLLFVAADGHVVKTAPLECPVEATIENYLNGDIDAADLNPWRDVLADEYLFKDISVDGTRLRLLIDPVTGEALPEPFDPCSLAGADHRPAQ